MTSHMSARLRQSPLPTVLPVAFLAAPLVLALLAGCPTGSSDNIGGEGDDDDSTTGDDDDSTAGDDDDSTAGDDDDTAGDDDDDSTSGTLGDDDDSDPFADSTGCGACGGGSQAWLLLLLPTLGLRRRL